MSALKAKATFRRLAGQLYQANGRDFEALVLPLIRLLAQDLVPAAPLGSFDRIGADLVAWGGGKSLSLVVQCKGFKVLEVELGESQEKQCRESVASFRNSKRHTARYVLVYNRRKDMAPFHTTVQAMVEELEKYGSADKAELWSLDQLVAKVADHLRERLGRVIGSRSAVASDEVEQTEVPFRRQDVVIDRYRFKDVAKETVLLGDPANDILSIGTGVNARLVLLGEAGYGKTTAALRATRSMARQVFVLKASGLVEKHSKHSLVNNFTFVDEFLAELPEEDLPLITPLARTAMDIVFSTVGTPAVLVIDGLDESIALTHRGGLQWLFNSIAYFQIPVVLIARTEFWHSRTTDFATSFGMVAQVKGSAQRDLPVKTVELLPWTTKEILAITKRMVSRAANPTAQNHLKAFAELISTHGYDGLYGDIPKRPLFLRMILETAAQVGIHAMNRVQLVDEWMRTKIIRDYIGPLEQGGHGRLAIRDKGESIETTIRLAYVAMMRAAALMTLREEGHLRLLPHCRLDRILEAEPPLREIREGLGLMLNSLLVPLARGDSEHVRFGHQLYQEYFLAKFMVTHNESFAESVLPTEVAQWREDLLRAGDGAK
jgi:hypothetical protein